MENNMFKFLIKTVRHFFPDFKGWLKEIKDPRKPEMITYKIEDEIWTGMFLFLSKLGSSREIRYSLHTEEVLEKLNYLTGNNQESVCHQDTLKYLLKRTSVEEILLKMVHTLIRKRVLEKYRLFDKYYLVSLDGTGCLSFNKRHCEKCLEKERGGKKIYYHQIVSANIVREDGMVFSVGSEFIENEEGASKQDCELKASYRLLRKIKKNYPQLKICVLLDSLYACKPIFEILNKNNLNYIITFKEGSMPEVYREFEVLKEEEKSNFKKAYKEKDMEQNYNWVNGIDYYGHKLNILECVEKNHKKNKETKWVWITNFQINENNVRSLSDKGGRLRWKIENEGFNMQKNGGYNLEHAYCLNNRAMKNFYLLLQIAHIINQLIERGSLLKNMAKQKFGSIKNISRRLFESIRYSSFNPIELEKELSCPFQIRLSGLDTS